MPPQERSVCILFADICDSMPIYEESGDVLALAVIARCLDSLAELAARYGGEVIRSKGDDVLCIFERPESALDAAAAMVDLSGPDIPAIHVGIHFGPVIRARRDIYGDAVNIAARMLAIAKPGEIVASKDLVDSLPIAERGRLALLGRRALKGKQAPIAVYSMVHDEGDATQVAWGNGGSVDTAPPVTISPSVVVQLEYGGSRVTVSEGQSCVLGRAERCNVVVSERCVSREHATVEVRAGRATLTDRSSTGSWILDAEGGHTTLRRDTGALRGHGTIRLGRHPSDLQAAPELGFTVQHRAP